MALKADTRLVVLLGHPVSHSLSPALHNAAFAACGLPYVYVACDVAPEALETAVAGIRALGIAGANVTVPHKQAVLGFLDEVEEHARAIGAVNTIARQGARLVGYNTDHTGFLRALSDFWPEASNATRVLLLGAGGAARAVVSALATLGIKDLFIWNRTHSRARDLCDLGRQLGIARCKVWLPADAAVLGRVQLVVHATSAGLSGGESRLPFDIEALSAEARIMDLQYGKTTLVSEARKRGLPAVDGTDMLIYQAAQSFELWTGVAAPISVMRQAIIENRTSNNDNR